MEISYDCIDWVKRGTIIVYINKVILSERVSFEILM